MALYKLIPRLLPLSLALSCLSISAFAQNGTNRPRAIGNTTEFTDISCSPDDPIIISTAAAEEAKPLKPSISLPAVVSSKDSELLKYQPMLLGAIDQRLGARYRWGATGPNRFDCSGFVWSIFQSAGINFERGSARSLWARFAPAAPEDQYKFGTLVFFSGLAHVGVVADENGFYHASRHHGVIYSRFDDYWMKRIDGFRRVPLPALQTSESNTTVAATLNQ